MNKQEKANLTRVLLLILIYTLGGMIFITWIVGPLLEKYKRAKDTPTLIFIVGCMAFVMWRSLSFFEKLVQTQYPPKGKPKGKLRGTEDGGK